MPPPDNTRIQGPDAARQAPAAAADAEPGARAAAATELKFPFPDHGCFGCSSKNADGLHLRFFDHGHEVRGTYRIDERFHGAPGIAHGGIVATILDEFSCAAAVFLTGNRVVTGELTVRYRRPCPVERQLEVVARVAASDHPRYLVIEAEILLDGEIAVRSSGKFFPQAIAQPAP